MADMTVEKNGSAALTMCVNETAPAPSEMTVQRWPSMCMVAIGSRPFTFSAETLGALRSGLAQRGRR
jgi:hypothetical protein